MMTLTAPPELIAAKQRRADARAQLGKAQTATARARRLHADALAAVTKLEASVATSHAEQGKRLAAQIAAGGPSDASAPADDQAPALTAARGYLLVTAEALATLEAEQATAAAERTAADKAVAVAAEAILDARAEQLAVKALRTFDELQAIAEELRGFAPDALDTPVNIAVRAASPLVQRALERIPPARDALHTPINQISSMTSGATWARRRAELMADDAGATEESVAA